MKLVIVLAVLLVIAAIELMADDEIEDLGVITSKIGIQFDKQTTRPGFSHFVLELMPLIPPTNIVMLKVTNDFITLQDLAALPSGRIVLGLATVFEDGSTSAAKLYRFDIRRGPPPAPRATVFQILRVPEVNVATSLAEILAQRKPTPPVPPLPAPFRVTGLPIKRTIPPAEDWPPPAMRGRIPPPLPQGTNETYGQHLDDMADYYSRPGRRNER